MGRKSPLLPLLRWAGSKKRQFTAVSKYFPRTFSRYNEPFAGSASFAFCMDNSTACLNDLNTDIIDFYTHCRFNPESFYDAFTRIPRTTTAFYDYRTVYNASPRSLQRSILFYYLNRNCYNGIYRLNKAGAFNVPFSNFRVSPYLNLQQFVSSASMLRQVTLFNKDFEEFSLSNMDTGDFAFIDPPYYASERIFSEYTAPPFDEGDFDRLLQVLGILDGRGVKFLLSYPEGPLAKKAAREWRSAKTPVLRTVAGDPSKRRRMQEMLIYNYDRRSA